MDTYVITQKSSEFVDSPVFHAGQEGDQEAIAVFTTRELAEQYLREADWQQQYEVGALRPVQLLRWFTVASENGTDMVMVDPDRKSQTAGEQQQVVYIGKPLSAFADVLRNDLIGKRQSEG